MDGSFEREAKIAQELMRNYKGRNYTFGVGCLESVGSYVREFGETTLLIISQRDWAKDLRKKVLTILENYSIEILEEVDTASPNTPTEDVFELANVIKKVCPQSITCVGGGSAIDCAKASNALASLSPEANDLEPFFGEGKVSEIARVKGKKLYPLVAVQVASGSGSHLTKYSNVTYTDKNQKKIIIDDILVPQRAVFDYLTTLSMSEDLTKDGAMDGFSHSLEVYLGYKNGDNKLVEDICLTSMSLIVGTLPLLVKDLGNIRFRELVGLATDLGGYAIMMGATDGPHLNSFSLVDILSHGRACAILLPYYIVFFSKSVRDKLKKLAGIFKDYINSDLKKLDSDKISSRELGEILAMAVIDFSKRVGFPTKLSEIPGFTDLHIDKMIEAAKNPQLESKLKSMPVPLSSSLVDVYMRPLLEAARDGDFSLIKNMEHFSI